MPSIPVHFLRCGLSCLAPTTNFLQSAAESTARALRSSTNSRYSRSSDFSKARSNFHARPFTAGLDPQRSRNISNLFRKFRLVDVDSDSDDDMANARGFGVHLGENAAELSCLRSARRWATSDRRLTRVSTCCDRRTHRQSGRERERTARPRAAARGATLPSNKCPPSAPTARSALRVRVRQSALQQETRCPQGRPPPQLPWPRCWSSRSYSSDEGDCRRRCR